MEAQQKRNAEATAERILRCAQEVFHEKGFDGATTREIADRAGANIALIKRYFGSKLGLFEKAVVPYLSLERFLNEPTDTLAERLASTYVYGQPMLRFDPFVVLLRSASSPEAGPILVDALERQAIVPLMRVLSGRHREARATLIATQLAGLILRLRILERQPTTEEEREAMRAMLEDYLNTLIAADT